MFISKEYRQWVSLSYTFLFLTGCRVSPPSADQLLIHFSQNVEVITQLTNATASLIGFIFIFRALLKLKIYGEMRSMMAPHARLSQIALLFFIGVLLISLTNGTIPVMVDAFFGSPVIKELQYEPIQTVSSEIQMAAKRIVQLMGLISLIRGIIQLGNTQEGGGRHSMGKSITHIISGVFAINVQQTIHLLMGLFGVTE